MPRCSAGCSRRCCSPSAPIPWASIRPRGWRRTASAPRPRFAALVAEVGAEAAGYALFWPIYDTEMGGPLMFLSDLFVAEAERGRGLAGDLMGAVARRALTAGHRGMSWEVLRDNHRARAFYRRLTAESDAVIVVNCAGDDFRRLAAEAPAGLSLRRRRTVSRWRM